MNVVAALVAASASLAALIISTLLGVMADKSRRRQTRVGLPPPTISDRIEQLRRNLASSRQLIDEVNAELEAQATNLERIKAEAEQNQRLAALNKEAADAVGHLLETVVQQAQQKTARVGTRQQWLFFLSGLLLSVPIGFLVNYLSK